MCVGTDIVARFLFGWIAGRPGAERSVRRG